MRHVAAALALSVVLAAPAAGWAQPPADPGPEAPAASPCAPTVLSPAFGAGRGGPPAALPGAATPGALPPVAAPTRPAPPPPTPATQPRPRDDGRHKAFVACAQTGDIDLLFVGDSITDWWQQANRGLPEYQARYGGLKVANFGIAGDTTQGVLWRMQNGELDGFKARLIVFMLGTNNINRNDNADIAAGDAAILAEFRRHQPQAKILLLGIFPRGAAPDNPFRAQIADINTRLAQLADGQTVVYQDIGQVFLTPDGTLTTEIMADGLHPTLKGYGLWADAIDANVKRLMAP